jgi:hypothetical protein
MFTSTVTKRMPTPTVTKGRPTPTVTKRQKTASPNQTARNTIGSKPSLPLLPLDTIGNIASYLPVKEKAVLARIDRSITASSVYSTQDLLESLLEPLLEPDLKLYILKERLDKLMIFYGELKNIEIQSHENSYLKKIQKNTPLMNKIVRYVIHDRENMEIFHLKFYFFLVYDLEVSDDMDKLFRTEFCDLNEEVQLYLLALSDEKFQNKDDCVWHLMTFNFEEVKSEKVREELRTWWSTRYTNNFNINASERYIKV